MKLIFPVFKGSRGGPGCLYSQTRFTSGFLHRFRRPWVVAAGVIVELIRRHAVKAGVRSFSVVEVEIDSNQSSGFCDCLIGLEIDLLILHAVPESFYQDVVSPAPFSIHPDSDVVLLELSSQSITGQLAARICIEDLRSATSCNGLFQCLQAEAVIHGWRLSSRGLFCCTSRGLRLGKRIPWPWAGR